MLKQGEKKNNRRIGSLYEEEAKKKLEQLGYQIVEANYWCKLGEIDFIARQKEYLVFIEVKYRSSNRKGTAAEAVTTTKQGKIKKVAQYYLVTHTISLETPIRFDVVAIDREKFTLYQNAFSFW